MPNYEDSKIYKITNTSNNIIYIGSTTNKYLSSRLQDHKKGSKNISQYMRVYNQYNYYIELIENYPCNNKNELNARKQYYINQNEPYFFHYY